MKLSREWCMPSIWTFTMLPVQRLFAQYGVGKGWADPFAGETSPAEITNDIEYRMSDTGHVPTYNMDGLEFLKFLPDESVDGVLFDPPYSVEQCLRRYTPKAGGTAGRAEYWFKCKDQIARVLRTGGLAISFGWDSTGMGENRGFDIIEVKLLCHGALHNDTIITVDRKLQGRLL